MAIGMSIHDSLFKIQWIFKSFCKIFLKNAKL